MKPLPLWARTVVQRLRKPLPGATVDPIMINGRWANPPDALLREIRAEAAKVVGKAGGTRHPDAALAQQSRERKISEEFHRRLQAAGIHVEGVS